MLAAFLGKEKIVAASLILLVCTVISVSLIFVLSALFPTASLAVITYSVLIIGIALLLGAEYKYSLVRAFKALKLDYVALAVLIVTTLVFFVVGSKLLFNSYGSLAPQSLGEVGYATSIPNAYGDLGWHVATITDLLTHRTFVPPNPIFAGNGLAYPFLANFLSAILISLGISLPLAITIPTVMFLPVMSVLLYALTKKLTAQPWAGVLVVTLFLLGGGVFGFLRQAADLSGNSNDPAGFYFLNPVISLLLPERAFIFGFGIAFAILYLLLQKNRWSYLVAGILAGLLPLFHVHTVMALVPAIIALWLLVPRSSKSEVGYFVVPALVLGLPEVAYYVLAMAHQPASISFHAGWMFDQNGIGGWVMGWLKNTGLLLPVTLLGFFLPLKKQVKYLAAAGLFIFIIGNLVLFAPWVWDNIKILIFWYLFTLPLVTATVVYAWNYSTIPVRALLAVLVVGHIIAGSADVLRIANPAIDTYPIWNAASVAFATAVQQHTPPDAVLLTASTFNSPGALTGRSLYLGYPAHVWTHGGNPYVREAAAKAFYTGLSSNLPDIQPTYVVVGPDELTMYGHVQVQPSWTLVLTSGPYSLYRL